jgi:hypothetical protein
MISENTLTGDRKMMNMAKVGTVVQSNFGQVKGANPRKQRAGGMTRYTLCVIDGAEKRNSRGTVSDFTFP